MKALPERSLATAQSGATPAAQGSAAPGSGGTTPGARRGTGAGGPSAQPWTGPHPATIYDVARHAGVAIATVSRALRGSAPVSEATRARVLAAVEELGFRPSHLGTSLAARRHAANGIVFPDLSGPYYAEVLLGYEETASRLGRSVLILGTRGLADADAAVLDLAGRVDGLVILGRTVSDTVVQRLSTAGLPVVLLARPAVGQADALHTESRAAAAALADHLAGHGWARLQFLGSPDASSDASDRYEGAKDALARRGVGLGVTRCQFDESAGRAAAGELLDRSHRPDALMCANDEIALGAMRAAEARGLEVGVDVAITGWDDVMAARHTRPALTTVRQPMRALGALAAEALDERITGTRTAPRLQLLPTELVVRETCGRHR